MKLSIALLVTLLLMAAFVPTNAASLAASIIAPLYSSTTVTNNAGLSPAVESASNPDNKVSDATLQSATWTTNFSVPKSSAMPQFRYLLVDMKIQGFDLGKFTGVDVKIDDQSAISKEAIDFNDLKKEAKKGEVYASPEGAFKGSAKFCKGNLTAGALTLREDGMLVIDTSKLNFGQYALEFAATHEGKKTVKDILIFFHFKSLQKITDSNVYFFTVVNPSIYLDDYCMAQANKNYSNSDGRIQSLAFSSYYDETLKCYWKMIDTPISANLRANTLWREAVKEQKPLEKLNVQGDCTHWVKLQKDGKDFSGWVNIKVSEQQSEPFLIQGPTIPFDGARLGPQKLWIREDGKDSWTIKSIDVRPNGVTIVTL